MLGSVLGDVTSWHRLYLADKPSHMGGRCGWASEKPSGQFLGLIVMSH
jgi:hypothetical protein